MIIVKAEGAPPCCRSEREFMRAIHDQRGVYIINANIPNSTVPGAFTREVDGVLLTPEGIYTVEVKGIRATGELHAPRMDAWAIIDGQTRVPLQGRPHEQALRHSKYLASFLKDTGIAPGWIRAVLAIAGENIRLPDHKDVLVTENVHVVLAKPGVGQVLSTQVAPVMGGREISAELVQAVLAVFECVESGPTRSDLINEGFRPEAAIAAEIENRRQQARAEFLAATTSKEDGHTSTHGSNSCCGHHAETTVALAPVADAPATSDWIATEQRFMAASVLDDELTETGAVVDGVALHKRLVAYADRKEVSLSAIASIVNNPLEVLGDSTEAQLIYCGEQYAVSVRALDRLAMFYKPIAVAKAERQGAIVDGVALTARAAKQAVGQFGLSLSSVARIVSLPEERWWVPGTTDIAHARGDFVAVTNGHLGPVQYVQTRAMAIHRATPKPVTEEASDPGVTDHLVDGVTIRASAVGWCHRRNVALDAVARIAKDPQAAWAGYSENIEVRTGESHAVLLDLGNNAVMAVMSITDAVEYRDGIVKDGVRISGRCAFLAKRRKRTIDEIIAAVRAPQTLARALGATRTYYLSAGLAVVVEDETNAVTDFTYVDHARALIQRGDLMVVDGPVESTPATASMVTGETARGPGHSTILAPVSRPGAKDIAAEPESTSVPSPATVAAIARGRATRPAAIRHAAAVASRGTESGSNVGCGSPTPSPLLVALRHQRSA